MGGYILVDPKDLENTSIKYYETMPDGRAILPITMMKVLNSIKNMQFVNTYAELTQMKLDLTLNNPDQKNNEL